jgi:hypothetical protein
MIVPCSGGTDLTTVACAPPEFWATEPRFPLDHTPESWFPPKKISTRD